MPIMNFMTSFYPDLKITGRPAGNPSLISWFIPIIFPTLFIFNSCTEKHTEIGINLLPAKDFERLRSVDTFTVESFTEYLDSVPAKNKPFSYLGGLYDPYFGNVSSDFVGQLRLTQKWPSSAYNVVIDSVKLFIYISGAKGIYGKEQNISLYEITEKLNADSTYYSTRNPHAGYFIGTFALPKIQKDSARTLEINLPISFGEYLLRDTTKLFQESTRDDFRDFFKGLYVTVSEEGNKKQDKGVINGGSLLLMLNFGSTGSAAPFFITIYYHTSAASNLTYHFVINDKSVRYNRYYHNFSTAEPGKKIKHINDGQKDTLSYLQSFYGVYTKIRFKGLSAFRDSLPVSVNRVRITVPVHTDRKIVNKDTIPSPVYLVYKTPEGYKYIVPDYFINPDYYNGRFSSSTMKFTFNIAAYVQSYLEGKIPEPELIMSLGDNEYRNIIFKANNSATPVKFELTYSRIR